MKKSHYIENGLYLDTTTGKTYQPKDYCELCKVGYGLTVHHYIPQQKALKDLKTKVKYPSTLTQEYLEAHQKLFTVCLDCHGNIHNMSENRFYERYGKEKDFYLKNFKK